MKVVPITSARRSRARIAAARRQAFILSMATKRAFDEAEQAFDIANKIDADFGDTDMAIAADKHFYECAAIFNNLFRALKQQEALVAHEGKTSHV